MAKKNDKLTEVRQVVRLLTGKKSMQLMAEMLSGNIIEIRPQLDFASELGFRYPSVEQILGTKGMETVAFRDAALDKNIQAIQRGFEETSVFDMDRGEGS